LRQRWKKGRNRLIHCWLWKPLTSTTRIIFSHICVFYNRAAEERSILYATFRKCRRVNERRETAARISPEPRRGPMEVIRMFDVLYLAIGIGAFLIITLYVFVCDRL
jgi:hypothetical protein